MIGNRPPMPSLLPLAFLIAVFFYLSVHSFRVAREALRVGNLAGDGLPSVSRERYRWLFWLWLTVRGVLAVVALVVVGVLLLGPIA